MRTGTLPKPLKTEVMVFQCFAILGFGCIAYQDLRERLVYWILFPLVGLFMALAYLERSMTISFIWNVVGNWILISLVLLLLWAYTKMRQRAPFLNHSIGLGDILFFYAMAFGFPMVTFLVLFTGSLLFSLAIHLIANRKGTAATVPLAGYMSLFLIITFLISYSSNHFELYLI
ncbi:hypothetical protein ABV409_14935 [Flagellimonas sp. DF-77]|uniref:hypothetical protein n=1 Tax=Flagellimonas algarum TaxID=3230298 RepID=UPI00339A6B6F